MASNSTQQEFLRSPREQQYEPVYRSPSVYNPLGSFRLPQGSQRHYQQQYGDMYFLRLAKLKPAVETIGTEAWEGFSIAGEHARRVDRVLDVRQGELSWVIGTVYMDMPLKPNILEDLTRDATPPPRRTYHDPSNPDLSQIMLEDESGRLRLTGSKLRSAQLTTGAIIAVLGTENADGDFEVIDMRFPDLPRQPSRWERDETPDKPRGGKIALISGLAFTGTSTDSLTLDLLTDYLLGYTGPSSSAEADDALPDASAITRVIIAGNSLGAPLALDQEATRNNSSGNKTNTKKYGYDSASYNASPITQLDNFLAELLPSIPITIMPGHSDPANFSVPQQPIHRAMFPRARAYCPAPPSGDEKPEAGWFDSVTNPWEGDVDGWRFYGTSGQNVDDVLRYMDIVDEDGNITNDEDGEARIRVMEAMMRWRCSFPTAPDTIWSYPFQTDDPFVIQTCPHLFFVGNQPQFQTAIIEGDSPLKFSGGDAEMGGTDNAPIPTVRLVAIPRFQETGEIVLVDSESLEVEVVRFGAFSGKQEMQ